MDCRRLALSACGKHYTASYVCSCNILVSQSTNDFHQLLRSPIEYVTRTYPSLIGEHAWQVQF